MLTKIRYGLALAGMAGAAALWAYLSRQYLVSNPLQDLATPAFYLLSLVGLGLRLFWARYLVISFCASMLGLNLCTGGWIDAACCGAVILLLSGSKMRQMFEDRAARWNRWAGARGDLGRLKLLFVAQSMALGLLYGYRYLLHCKYSWDICLPTCSHAQMFAMTAPLVVTGLGLVGLILHRTWGVLPLLAALVLETIYGVRLATAEISTTGSMIMIGAVVASLLLLLPLLAGMTRHMLSARDLR